MLIDGNLKRIDFNKSILFFIGRIWAILVIYFLTLYRDFLREKGEMVLWL